MAIPAEEPVGAFDCTLLQLDDSARTAERGERHAPEQRGAERLHRQRQLSCMFAAFGTAACQFPTSLVPRAKLVRKISPQNDASPYPKRP